MSDDRRERLERYRARRRRLPSGGANFEQLVAEALDELPHAFRQRVVNVAIVVEDWPSAMLLRSMGMGQGQTLLGLYQGIPLHARGGGYALVPPDRITLFRGPILERCATARDVIREVRATLQHEIGHYFGLSDRELT